MKQEGERGRERVSSATRGSRAPRRSESLSLPSTAGKCTVSGACAWGEEPVSTTKTPSRARNYDYRAERERNAQLEKLRARSFIPSKKIGLRDVQLPVHPVLTRSKGIFGEGERGGERGPANSYRSCALSDNSGNKGWSEMMAWRGLDDAA